MDETETEITIGNEKFADLLSERPDVATGEIGEVDGEVTAPPSATALKMDEWSERRGSEAFYESEAIQSAYSDLGVPANPGDGDWRHTAEQEKIIAAELATQDFHAAAFEPSPELAENPKDQRIARYMRNLMDTPEFQALHEETQFDEAASEMATAHFAKQWVSVVQQEEPEDEFDADMQALAAASQAVSSASDEVGDFRDAQDALGGGSGNGAPGERICKAELMERFQRVRRSRALSRICQLAGRYRRMAQAAQRRKVLHGQDDVVGITLGDNVSSLVPSELAQLADEEMETDVMRRIVESCAMVRDHRGIEKVARGPIVVVVDESGSMHDEPIAQAKAYALAMYWIARHQNRYCCLVGFSGSAEGNFLVIKPGEDKTPELMDWLEHFFGGGTDMDIPLVELPRKWESLGVPQGKTDIINITDAICHVREEMASEFNSWKARTLAKYSVILVGCGDGESLRCVADRIWTAESIDVTEAAVTESFASV